MNRVVSHINRLLRKYWIFLLFVSSISIVIGLGVFLVATIVSLAFFNDPVEAKNPTDYFTEDELRSLYEEANERMWVVNGQSPDNYGIPQRSAVSLWTNIETEADRYISHNLHGATLRFGHDSSLYRLLSLMGVSSLSDERFDDMDKAIPMAANLQMVFYSNGKNVIVQILHNEQQVKLFREQDKNGFYTWSQVKKYMRKRINKAEKLGLLQRIKIYLCGKSVLDNIC